MNLNLKQNNQIPIYLVSLDEDTQRRETLAKDFPLYYPNITRVSAVDGRKITAKSYYNSIIDYYRRTNKVLSPAELGCTLSHIKALKLFLNSDNEFALILEDDVIGNDKNIDDIFSLTTVVHPNSLLICGGQEGLNARKYQFGKKSKYEGLTEISMFSYRHVFRTCCYLVTKNSAKAIVDYQERNLTLADKWDVFFKDTDIKIFYKNSLSHPKDLANSHIEQDRAYFKNKTSLQKFFSKNILERVAIKLYNETQFILHKIKGYKSL
ncbi:glycosyltransferase family 25 protein [Tenacibaculum soleae]|uniref:Glycosyl transferase family 25 domain-containing protein n=1 Tax=Tenacibaculum soleae TaxID=447689 RepID=A0A1B9XZT9_9FLAO|nr:glycosyltransferase family 25 protein [Tenacibaculum soleae]MDO6811817.1 glycosyltransferase family 25 protein [Tenacibaculum soleae]OCK43077.1 hypothetical protein BA195_09320 [Tenacibaculum soleae]